jgi:hypothetical protein
MPEPHDSLTAGIETEADEIEAAALDWAIAHEKRAAFWDRFHFGLGLPSVVLAAAAGTAAITELGKPEVVVALLALAVAVLSALITFLSPRECADRHEAAPKRYMAVSSRLATLRNLDLPVARDDEDRIRSRLRELSETLVEIKGSTPRLPKRYKYWLPERERRARERVKDRSSPPGEMPDPNR